MDQVRIRLDGRMEEELEGLLRRIGPDGYITKHFIAMVEGKLRAEVRSDEHPPPHFHITYDGEDASYSIVTGDRLPNVCGLERYDQMIRLWWKKNKREIALKWNGSRPTGCSVGAVAVPD
jgi:hypothetical protein